MLFNSTLYLAFLVVVVTAFHQLRAPGRRVLLVLASYAFYWVWSIPFSLLLVGSTLVDYTAARVIGASQRTAVRRAALVGSLVFNLGILALFKYADFFSDASADVFGVRPWSHLGLILPLGISFYTFQTMSYTIDVYRGNLTAHRSFVDVALYVSFFPQLVAGPIVRADVLLPQLRCTPAPVDWLTIRHGIGLVVYGLVKKVIFADGAAHLVNQVYGAPGEASGLALLIATYGFAVQIYCDFSGYSDIAIGSAMLLGIRLPENFDRPYLSASITEFWRRWHLSLSSWLRDYLYISLGGNRRGVARTYVNLMLTMLLGGLWHGAGWNWLVWGGLHGLFLCVERALGVGERPTDRVRAGIQVFWTFQLVCLSWVFFRAADFDTAMIILGRIVTWAPGELGISLWPLVAVALVFLSDALQTRGRWLAYCGAHPRFVRALAYVALLVFGLIFAEVQNPEFIYFQF